MSSLVTSCYKDHSTTADELIPDILIGNFAEEGYTVESFVGNKITLVPQITTNYPEEELTYEWYLIDRQAENSISSGDVYTREHIASGKKLDYEVSRSPGDYLIIIEVTANNGYMQSKTTTLHAVTSFSQGFYILKETTDGHTELDLFNPATNMFKENIFTTRDGHPIEVAPLYLSACQNHSYIDTSTNETTHSDMITVTTVDGNIHVMRTSDLREVLNRDNLLFESWEEGEIPYRIVTNMWLNAIITNKGIRSQYEGSISPGASGRYGLTNGITASPHCSINPVDNGLYFWDNTTSSICHCDYNGTIVVGADDSYKIYNLRNNDCLHTGYNQTTNYTIFVTRNRLNKATQLYCIKAEAFSGFKVEKLLNLSDYKINSATMYTTCFRSAGFLYGLTPDGKIWAFDMDSQTERQITPAGIPDDEDITYISDKSLYDAMYFVVGTKKGDRYTLRFYNMLGGITDGQPIHTISSTGTIRAIQYTADLSSHYLPPIQD